jgi:hypothetical protein
VSNSHPDHAFKQAAPAELPARFAFATTEWSAGLRDRVLPVTAEQRLAVEGELRGTIQSVIRNVFRYHGLETCSAVGCGAATRG